MSDLLVVALAATAAGAALTAGALFAFSSFVMRALSSLPPAVGLRAMQAINAHAPTGLFMAPLVGSALGSTALCVHAVVSRGTGWEWQLAGSTLVLLSFALTVAYHVPRNDALGMVRHDSTEAVTAWQRYVPSWTRWNHLRTALAALGAATLLVPLP